MGHSRQDQFRKGQLPVGHGFPKLPPGAADLLRAVPPGAQVIGANQVPKVSIDGFEFPGPPIISGGDIWIIYLAISAKRGDQNARDVMETFKIRVEDMNNKRIWPPVEEPPQKSEEVVEG